VARIWSRAARDDFSFSLFFFFKAREPFDFLGQQFKIAFILRFRARDRGNDGIGCYAVDCVKTHTD
jgi:hypothetical protein